MFKASRVKYLPSCTAMTNALDMLCSFVSGDAQGSNFEVVPTWQGCVLPQLGDARPEAGHLYGKITIIMHEQLTLTDFCPINNIESFESWKGLALAVAPKHTALSPGMLFI